MTVEGRRRTAWVSLGVLSQSLHGNPGAASIDAVVPTDGGPPFGSASGEILDLIRLEGVSAVDSLLSFSREGPSPEVEPPPSRLPLAILVVGTVYVVVLFLAALISVFVLLS